MILNSLIILLVTSLRPLTSSADTEYRNNPSPWNLPLLPANPHEYPNYTIGNDTSKKIPKLAWIGFRKAPKAGEKLQEHIINLKKNNLDWTFHLWGNEEEHHFMETYFFNTSILWAFKHVNPAVGVSYSDIWRLCVLWAYGGFYIDDDSYINTPLDKIISGNDTLILSREKGLYVDCYQPYYKLSDKCWLKQRNLPSNSTSLTDLYSNRNLVNWALFSNPRNEMIQKALENIVEIFKFEYLKRPVFNTKPYDPRFLKVFCSTGL
jgi:mannosyltransferase OCH1-like enzyme